MYNYSEFDARNYDLVNFRGPMPGTRAPDFELRHPDASSGRLLDFQGSFLVLEMGSLTCPLFQGRRKPMTHLDQEHGDVSFAVLYVREAHPGQRIPAHSTEGEKQSCASRLAANGENRKIFIDDLEGTAHKAYGSYPNSVFIINRNGCVVYASDWNNPATTGRALTMLKNGKPAQLKAWFKPVSPAASWKTLRAGGKGSMHDFLWGLPRLVWNNLVLRNIRLLLGKAITVAPNNQC